MHKEIRNTQQYKAHSHKQIYPSPILQRPELQLHRCPHQTVNDNSDRDEGKDNDEVIDD